MPIYNNEASRNRLKRVEKFCTHLISGSRLNVEIRMYHILHPNLVDVIDNIFIVQQTTLQQNLS